MLVKLAAMEVKFFQGEAGVVKIVRNTGGDGMCVHPLSSAVRVKAGAFSGRGGHFFYARHELIGRMIYSRWIYQLCGREVAWRVDVDRIAGTAGRTCICLPVRCIGVDRRLEGRRDLRVRPCGRMAQSSACHYTLDHWDGSLHACSSGSVTRADAGVGRCWHELCVRGMTSPL